MTSRAPSTALGWTKQARRLKKNVFLLFLHSNNLFFFKTLFPRYSDSSASILSTSYCHAPKGPSNGTVRCVDRPHANCSARVAAAGAACYEDFGQLGDAALRGQRLRATTPPSRICITLAVVGDVTMHFRLGVKNARER